MRDNDTNSNANGFAIEEWASCEKIGGGGGRCEVINGLAKVYWTGGQIDVPATAQPGLGYKAICVAQNGTARCDIYPIISWQSARCAAEPLSCGDIDRSHYPCAFRI